MKIKEYDTNELLMIANNVTGEYSDKQVRQAKEEQKLYFTSLLSGENFSK